MQPRTRGVGVEVLGDGFGKKLIEIDADDLCGDGVAGPALLDQGDEQGAGHFQGAKAAGGAGGGVGVALHGGVGGDDQDVAGVGGGAGGLGSRLDDAQDGGRAQLP